MDRGTVLQIFGSLMHSPGLLAQKEKYTLSPNDFSTALDRIIFIAIHNLFENGAQNISVVDVDTYLDTNLASKTVFERENGIAYLTDAVEYSNPENFPFYYQRLKKLNAVKDLQKVGIDTNSIYNEDLIEKGAKETNERFELMSVSDIFDSVRDRLLTVESAYGAGDTSDTISADEGLAELVESLKLAPDIGASLQGRYFNTVCRGARKGKYYVRSAGSGVGKALPNSEPLPTPSGWKTVGEVQVGDYLFDAFGKPTRVLKIHPQGEKQVWEVEFKDGRTVRCCEDHLWSFNTRGQREKSKKERKFFTKSLREIAEMELQQSKGKYKILVPNSYAVEYDEKKYYIPPYVFGLFLGDGSFRQHPNNKAFTYSSEDEELPKYIAETMNWRYKKNSDFNYNWTFEFIEKSDELGEKRKNVWVEDVLGEHQSLLNTKSENKFIPREYLEGSVEQRFDLLSGLLDSDGTVDEQKGRISFFTVSEKMRDNVMELAFSLGLKASYAIDSHKETNDCYIIHIAGRPEDKVKLFKLQRKKHRILQWHNNGKRKESNTHNPIIAIRKLEYFEEMTCFEVDNHERLFLTNDFIVTHNSRSLVGDACHLAFPIRFNRELWQWEYNGNNEKTLFIMTEQEFDEIQTLILAYLTEINEDKILYGKYSLAEEKVIKQALWLIEEFKDNLKLVQMPNPTVGKVQSVVRANVRLHDIQNVFFDYIFINSSLASEFGGGGFRNDEILLILSTALKDLAVELGIFLMTATQLSPKDTSEGEIKDERNIRGSKAIIDKADIGAIISHVTAEEKRAFEDLEDAVEIPNQVLDIFKVRRGQYSRVRIWMKHNLGTCRREDLFMTDASLNVIENVEKLNYQLDIKELNRFTAIVKSLNKKLDENNGL